MSGTSAIVVHYLADPAAMGQAFATGALADNPEGYVVVEFLEEVAGQEDLHDLVALVAAYQEALAFGDRPQMQALGQVIDSELQVQRTQLAKIQLKLGRPSPTKPVFFSPPDNWLPAVRQTLAPTSEIHVEMGPVSKTRPKSIQVAAIKRSRPQGSHSENLTAQRIKQIFAVNGKRLERAFTVWKRGQPPSSLVRLGEPEMRDIFLTRIGIRFFSDGLIDTRSVEKLLESSNITITELRSYGLGRSWQGVMGVEECAETLEWNLLNRDIALTLLGRPIP